MTFYLPIFHIAPSSVTFGDSFPRGEACVLSYVGGRGLKTAIWHKKGMGKRGIFYLSDFKKWLTERGFCSSIKERLNGRSLR